ncbi:MAG: cobaltochelatase subunit CobN [Bacteroidales bacterium]|nr:cobaltochelatase subunit CobN [Bacteroidales bacterium]
MQLKPFLRRHRRKIGIGLASLLLLGVLVGVWRTWLGTTRIAFVNFPTLQLGHIAKANDNALIDIVGLNAEDIESIDQYDMVFINAMGLRITEAQREAVQLQAMMGRPIMSIMVTNPDNDIISLDTAQTARLQSYFQSGGRENYRQLLRYVRRDIDGKILMAPEALKATPFKRSLLYHRAPRQPEAEEKGFNSVRDYEAFLRESGVWNEQGTPVVITGPMGEPFELTSAFEEAGFRAYYVEDIAMAIEKQHIDTIRPAAIINMAHGRLGEEMVAYLDSTNIPFFAPLNTQQLVEDWERPEGATSMGMSGGMLSQSITMPEIDGAVRPYAVFGHRKDKEGLLQVYAMPQRVKDFVQTVGNYTRLRTLPNKDKRLAIFYFKGPGQSALAAQGLEVVPSLYNFLKRLQQEGYDVKLPASPAVLEQMLQNQGSVLGGYAKGRMEEFMRKGNPELISKAQYETWVKQSLHPEVYKAVVKASGEFPGQYLVSPDGRLGVPRIDLGNVVLLPQLAAAEGSDQFQIVHGVNATPPHAYIAEYLWAQHGFKADAMLHFGTHGSLEFTPHKQTMLSSLDWPDRLVGTVPHFYLWTIANVGESIMAKRRAYATLQSYLTPPFLESNLRSTYSALDQAIHQYNHLLMEEKPNPAALREAGLKVKKLTVQMGMHRELGLDSILTQPYSESDVERIEAFAEELSTEKIGGQLYTLGLPFSSQRLNTTVMAMSADPIAYNLLALDKMRKRKVEDAERHRAIFTARYLNPAKAIVARLLANPAAATDQFICTTAKISPQELAKARETYADLTKPKSMMAMMPPPSSKNKGKRKKPSAAMMAMMRTAAAMGLKAPHGMGKKEKEEKKPTGMPADVAARAKALSQSKEYTRAEKDFAFAVMEVERTIKNVGRYREHLLRSPQLEIDAMIDALSGGYIKPGPGGDPIANPNALPTGRNMYSINAEATPSEAAWEKAKHLVKNTLDTYRRRHNDSLPRKVSYTLWSSEFIETEGATIAQALYMLGVEPVRDPFGRVNDLRLIPSQELGRPRIDVVVQTSGQLRDLAASRLFLIQRAVRMAAEAKDETFTNEVVAGVEESERVLVEKGVSPKDARELAARRVFGGVNGNYGTGIQGMVMASDKWEGEKEVADTYLNNMGAFYGDEKRWEEFQKESFTAALTRTDVVVQPRQSNTWGALSLDHVFEFMGGLNLAVRNVTGKDPDAYLSDYRNRNRVRMQEVKEAIGVESRTTIFNPEYIREQMKGEATAAAGFEEYVKNTFGWEVMKPEAIDDQLWSEIYEVYVKDKHKLGTREFFESKNPAALQTITGVMLESVRKGMWKASNEQVQTLAKVHTELVAKYGSAGTQFAGGNQTLNKYIASKVDAEAAKTYEQQIDKMREAAADGKNGTVLKKEELNAQPVSQRQVISGLAIGAGVLALLVAAVFFVRKRRRSA